uniref:Uncharacterized protein n=1 Tax=Rhizophora mucronata TaxID=61149 RepID=A0A2P2N1D7_RHIMU
MTMYENIKLIIWKSILIK